MYRNNSQLAVYSGCNILHIFKVIQNTAELPTVCLLLKIIFKSNLKSKVLQWALVITLVSSKATAFLLFHHGSHEDFLKHNM